MSNNYSLDSTAVSLKLAAAGATAYECRDYYGTVVSSGSVSGTSFAVITPSGGWKCGWYRVYLTGPNTDANYGNSYGAYNFCVIRDTAGFSKNSTSLSSHYGGEKRDVIAKGVLGIGTSRLSIGDTANYDPPGQGAASDALTNVLGEVTNTLTYAPSDPARPWPLMTNFPNGTVSGGGIPGATGSTFMVFLEKDTSFTPNSMWFDATTGTNANTWKLRVYYPDSATLVETIDNLPLGANNAAATINSTSTHVKAFGYNGTYQNVGQTLIDGSNRLGVRACVSSLYTAGVTRFEGPSNEPNMNVNTGTLGADFQAHKMMLFQSDVHAGNASAKAIGPCTVQITAAKIGGFFDNGGGAYCDELSFHAYNAIVNGDINLGRHSIETFQTLLASYGLSALNWWHTEANHTFCSVFGVHHPRRSRVPLLMTLLWEQYGLPRERNMVWYDIEHGFWSYPAWWEDIDGSLAPYAVLYRTLAEETWGMLHHHRFDFGSVQANRMFLGSVYMNTSTDVGCLVVQAQSYMGSNYTITVELTGTVPASVTVVDAWGNESTETVTSGLVTYTIDDVPTYLQLPAGCKPRISAINDWGTSPNPNIASLGVATVGGSSASAITDGSYLMAYNGGTNNAGVITSSAALPDTAEVSFAATANVDRVIIVCGGVWQSLASFTDFDIQTTTDGVNWTTRKTVTVDDTTPTFRHGTNAYNQGCYMETFWTEQWIFDITLPATYACTGVRALVRSTSNGGEPSTIDATTMGQGDNSQRITIQEFIIPSGSSPTTTYDTYANTVLADSPVGYWRFGERSGTTAVDSSVNAINGTYPAGTTLGDTGATGDGDAAYTPTASHVMSVAHNVAHDVGDTFSIEFWAQGINANGYSYLFGKNGNQSAPLVRFIYGYLTLFGRDTLGNAWTIVAQSNVVSDASWTHWVVTKSGTSTHIYKNGIDVTATTPSQIPGPFVYGNQVTFSNPNASMFFGGEDGGDAYGFPFDEGALYSTVLTPARVLAHYQAAATPAGSPTNTTAPSIEGTAAINKQLSVLPGVWAPQPTYYTYQWQRSTDGGTTWTDITGETHSVLTVPGTDSTHKIKCLVAAGSATGLASAVSSDVQTIA